LLSLLLVACGSSKKKNEETSDSSSFSKDGPASAATATATQPQDEGDLILVSRVGDSFSPSFSDNNQEVIFLSGDRPTHRRVEAYTFNLKEKKERRLTFSSGSVSSAVAWKTNYYFISDTEALKESPSIFREDSGKSTPLNDLFELNDEKDELLRLSNSSDYYRNLRIGKTTLFWSQGHEAAQVMMKKDDGALPISFLPKSPDISATVDRTGGWWAWVQRIQTDKLEIKIRSPSGETQKIAIDQLQNQRVQDLHFEWWNLEGQPILLILKPDMNLNYSLWSYLPNEKCEKNLSLQSGKGPIQALVPSSKGDQFLLVTGMAPNRSISLSKSEVAGQLRQQLVDSPECGVPMIKTPLASILKEPLEKD